MDGKIIIGTGVDTKGLQKDLAKLEKELEKYVKDEEKLTEKKLNLEIDTQRALDDLQTLDDRVENLKKKLQSIETRKNEIVPWKRNESNPEWNKLNQDYDTIKAKIGELTRKEEDIVATRERQLKQINDINDELRENAINQEITKNKIEETTNELKKTKINIDFSPMFKKMHNNLEKISKKVSRLGLTLLGVKTIYGMMTSAISRIKEENKDFASYMQTITNMFDIITSQIIAEVLPTAKEILPTIIEIANIILNVTMAIIKLLLPVIKAIAGILKFIVDLFGGLASDLFGIDMSTNNFAKGLDKSNKKAQALRKILMGFDEMNILNKDTGSTGAISGYSYDQIMSNLGVDTTPDTKHKENTGDFIDYLMDEGYFDKTKYEELNKYFAEEKKVWQNVVETALSQGKVKEINGIVYLTTEWGDEIRLTREEWVMLIDGYINGIKWSEKAIAKWKGIKEYVTPAYKKFHATTITISKDLKNSIITDIKDLINNFSKNLDGATYTYKDGMYEITMTNGKVVKLTEEQWKELQPYMKYLGLNIVNDANGVGGKIQSKSKETKDKVVADAKETKDEIVGYINEISGTNDKTNNEILDGTEGACIGVVSAWNGAVGVVTGGLGEIPQSAEDDTKSALGNIDYLIKNHQFPQRTIKFNVDTNSIQNAVAGAVIGGFTIAYSGNYTGGGRHGAKGLLLGLPHLARGGIVNKVGSGVPIGSAVVGERGREAVVPLTDSQQMAYLGKEIAKNIVVNLTNVTELDGKQLARSITKVMQDTQFASNGGVI